MVVHFELWWGGRKRHRHRFTWTLDVQWAGVPRPGDHVSLGIPFPQERGSWTVRDVEWRDNSIHVRLVDVWTNDEKHESDTVNALRQFAEQHGGGDDYIRAADEWVNPDKGVRAIVWVLEVLEGMTAYELGLKIKRIRYSPTYAYSYIAVWLGALLVILVACPLEGLWLIPLLLVVWRTVDLSRWYLDLFLDRAHSHLMSTERNLVMAIINLGELVVIGAIFFRAAEITDGELAALFGSFLLVTQLDVPNVEGVYQAISVVAVEIVALLLLLGGVAALIAEIQEKLITSGTWRGERRR